MPNHVKNELILTGEQSDIDALLKRVKSKVSEFDFNKIIRMPKALNIESGSRTTNGLNAYKDFVFNYYIYYGRCTRPNLIKIPEELEQAYFEERAKVTKEEWELGKRAFQNQIKYGAPTWYDWANWMWDTKWNAYEVDVFDNIIRFNTAWSRTMPIVSKLAEMFPTVSIEYKWADEDIGANVGFAKFEHGILVEDTFHKTGSKEAVDLATSLWELGDNYFDV